MKQKGESGMRQAKGIVFVLLIVVALSSCKTNEYINVSGVAYQSVRAKDGIAETSIPADATIIVYCQIHKDGSFDITVKNNTDEIMTIDRTRSFFRDIDNNSIPYYDPSVSVNTQSVSKGNTTGSNVNLGAVAKAAGVGGALGTALNGVNVSNSNTNIVTNTETTYHIDQQFIHIAPHGSASLGRTFRIIGIGSDFLDKAISRASGTINNVFTHDQTYALGNVCISYSLDAGVNYETIVTDYYANTLLIGKVIEKGKVNDALRSIYVNKRDALEEPWFLLHFKSRVEKNNDYHKSTTFINYK